MKNIRIEKEMVEKLFDSKYIKIYDLQYAEGKHYFDASRRNEDDLTATKSLKEFKTMLPDAVSCCVIIIEKGKEPRLLLTQEYRYPTGQFLLSPPAGLMDPEDKLKEEPMIETARREIEEETGLRAGEKDRFFVMNPCLFSTPGMSDESNALVCGVLYVDDLSALSQEGAVGSEAFDGFELLTKEEALKILKQGTDSEGKYFSVYTWAILLYFVSDAWK